MAGDKFYTEDELKKKSVAELKELAVAYIDEDEIDDIRTKQPLFAAIIDNQGEPSDDDEEDDDVELDDEEEDDLELPDEDEVDDEEVDEVDDEKPAAKERKPRAKKQVAEKDTLAAKQVATELGTDAKTLRQFFRSPASTVEAVGSGGRYEFNASDVPQIKAEFEAWKAGHAARGSKRTGEGGSKRGRAAAQEIVEVEEVEELEIEDEDLELDD